MKTIYSLTLIFIVVMLTLIGCLIIFEIFTMEQGLDYIYKSIAAIVLIGVSSAAVVFVTAKNKSSEETDE